MIVIKHNHPSDEQLRERLNDVPRPSGKVKMANKKSYPQVHSGEKVEVKWRTQDYKMACCDCGLVHRLRFNVKGGTLVMRGWRDNRATAQIRRKKK